MHPSRLLSTLCIAVSLATPVKAQDDSPDTPPSSPVQLAQYPGAPLEDRAANLWFGTVTEGLIRYDGHAFTTFTTDDGLGDNTIRDILESDDGTLWFATTGGLTKYNGETFTTLTEYEPIRVKRGFSQHGHHRDLWDVHLDQHDALWIATMDGVFRHDGDMFKRFEMPKVADKGQALFHPRMVDCIFEDTNGDLWFGTDGAGAFKFDGENFTSYTVESHNLAGNNITTIIRDRRGDYWFGTANAGVSRFDGDTFTTHLRSNKHSIHSGWGRYLSIIEDQQGFVWFGAAYEGGGVYRYDGEAFKYFSTAEGLGNGGVPSIRMDRTGDLWFGTTAGVYRYEDGRFVNFTRNNPGPGDAVASPHDPFEGWFAETIAFPPGFAQGMPAGKEELRFPPGWRKPETEDFWSYAIVMLINEPIPDAERIETLLDLYYDGLMLAFGVGQDSPEPTDPAQVKVTQTGPNNYDAQMRIIDGFATKKPIDIRIKIEAAADNNERSTLRIRLSPQPDEHEIWHDLQRAIENIQNL